MNEPEMENNLKYEQNGYYTPYPRFFSTPPKNKSVINA